MTLTGRTLKVFVMGRSPSSLKTVEIVNWTGLAFLGSRRDLSQVRSRSELSQPGIYLLLSASADETTDLVQIYIGETEDFVKRLSNHTQRKQWWDKFIVFVSKDHNLTKAHVRYLEAELYQLAKKSIATLKIENETAPGGAQLPESDRSSMQEFLQNIRFVLETLGLSYFPSEESESKVVELNSESDKSSISGQEFYLRLPKEVNASDGEQLSAYMTIKDELFVLKKGSYIRRNPVDSFEHSSYHGLWKQISGSDAVEVAENPMVLRTLRDIEFRSASAAGAVAKARSTNGRTAWRRLSDDKVLNECEGEMFSESA